MKVKRVIDSYEDIVNELTGALTLQEGMKWNEHALKWQFISFRGNYNCMTGPQFD